MRKRIKYGKLLIVIFLTALIWVRADLALQQDVTISNITIALAKSTPDLWISFDGESSANIKKIDITGPASKIAELKKLIREGRFQDFILDPQQEGLTSPPEQPLNVLNFLKKTDKIKQLGLTAISSEPEILSVDIVRLVKKTLDVRCVDADQITVKTKTIDPAQVEMFVPEDWSGEKLIAEVLLTRPEIKQAKTSAITKTPYIRLAKGNLRKASTEVSITTTPEETRLRTETVKGARLNISLSSVLQGKYEVEISNLAEVIGPIAIRATAEAKRAYEMQPVQMILFVLDDDKNSTEELRREVVYNFPEEYIRKDEIILDQTPSQVRYKLIPLELAEQNSQQ